MKNACTKTFATPSLHEDTWRQASSRCHNSAPVIRSRAGPRGPGHVDDPLAFAAEPSAQREPPPPPPSLRRGVTCPQTSGSKWVCRSLEPRHTSHIRHMSLESKKRSMGLRGGECLDLNVTTVCAINHVHMCRFFGSGVVWLLTIRWLLDGAFCATVDGWVACAHDRRERSRTWSR